MALYVTVVGIICAVNQIYYQSRDPFQSRTFFTRFNRIIQFEWFRDPYLSRSLYLKSIDRLLMFGFYFISCQYFRLHFSIFFLVLPRQYYPIRPKICSKNNFFKFVRILSCLLLLSLQSLEQEVIQKINIGLISLTIAGFQVKYLGFSGIFSFDQSLNIPCQRLLTISNRKRCFRDDLVSSIWPS